MIQDTTVGKALEFYQQTFSIESNSDAMAVLTATFANDGICPLTQ